MGHLGRLLFVTGAPLLLAQHVPGDVSRGVEEPAAQQHVGIVNERRGFAGQEDEDPLRDFLGGIVVAPGLPQRRRVDVIDMPADQLRERRMRAVGDILMKQLEIGHRLGVGLAGILSRPNAAGRASVTEILDVDASDFQAITYAAAGGFVTAAGKRAQTFPNAPA